MNPLPISHDLDSRDKLTGVIRQTVPVPTYFTLGKYALPENVEARIIETGGEVANNLVFLGRFTHVKDLLCSSLAVN